MSLKEQVVQEIDRLEEDDLLRLVDYMAFLKFQSRRNGPSVDASDLAALYAEFADEDKALAEEGMAEYAAGLAQEDAA